MNAVSGMSILTILFVGEGSLPDLCCVVIMWRSSSYTSRVKLSLDLMFHTNDFPRGRETIYLIRKYVDVTYIE
jgi:hypothetical protein